MPGSGRAAHPTATGTLSTSNWRTTCHRLAPRAERMAISFCLSAYFEPGRRMSKVSTFSGSKSGLTCRCEALILSRGRFFCKNLFRNVETRPVRTSLLQSRENVSDSETNKLNATIKTITVKYALLVHVNKEAVDQFKDENAKAAAAAAGRAYGEALRAAGVFVAGAGLGSPQTATK